MVTTRCAISTGSCNTAPVRDGKAIDRPSVRAICECLRTVRSPGGGFVEECEPAMPSTGSVASTKCTAAATAAAVRVGHDLLYSAPWV